MILALLLASGALAADVVWSGGASVSFGALSDAGAGGLGHEVNLGVPVSERWLVEAVSTSAAGLDAARFTLMAGARRYLSEPFTGAGALSVSGDVGLDLFGRDPTLSLGAAIDLPTDRRWGWRVGGGWELGPSDGQLEGVARLSLTAVIPPPRAVTVTELVPPPPPPPAEESPPFQLEGALAEARIWIPHPVCAWVPASEAEALIASLDEPLSPEATLEVLAEGYAVDHIDHVGVQHVELLPEPDEGALVVLAWPGDRIVVKGASLPAPQSVSTGADGVAVVKAPEGRLDIEVRAGGQRQSYKAALANGYAVWVRVRPPPPVQVLFAQGQSDLNAAARAQIAAMAQDAGGWSFVLQGAYSAEGSLNYNNRLARERGLNVGAALMEAGVPADHIAYLEPPPADPNKDPVSQRACIVLAVPPERAP